MPSVLDLCDEVGLALVLSEKCGFFMQNLPACGLQKKSLLITTLYWWYYNYKKTGHC